MPHSVELEQHVLDEIADAIAEFLPPGLEPFAETLEIAETFEIWTLENPSAATLTDATVPAGAYHHQLVGNGAPVGFAESWLEPGGAPPQVTKVLASPLARQIAEAVEMADAESPATEDVEVRLLFAYRHQVCALWFLDPRLRCLVVCAPARFETVVAPKMFLDGADFLARIAPLRPVQGLVFEPPDSTTTVR